MLSSGDVSLGVPCPSYRAHVPEEFESSEGLAGVVRLFLDLSGSLCCLGPVCTSVHVDVHVSSAVCLLALAGPDTRQDASRDM